MNWTHTNIKITDIRKSKDLYILNVKIDDIKNPLFVNERIFNERMNSYFLNNNRWSREDVLEIKWNFYITKGYYVKINKIGEIENINADPNKFYVSYIEINGDLGSFNSIYNENNLK